MPPFLASYLVGAWRWDVWAEAWEDNDSQSLGDQPRNGKGDDDVSLAIMRWATHRSGRGRGRSGRPL